MAKIKINYIAGLGIGLAFMGCTSTNLLTAPPLTISSNQLRNTPLNELEEKRWGHLDLIRDTVPGMSVDRAYDELLKRKKVKPIVVAVIDSGIDLNHEDLKEVLWVNPGEKPNDGIDNDGNGYIDDIHGYNFLGESYHEQLEFVRILRLKIGDEALQSAAKAELEAELPEAQGTLPQLEQIQKIIKMAHENIQKELGKEYYSLEDLEKYKPKSPQEEQIVGLLSQVFGMGQSVPEALADLQEGITYYKGRVEYNLNVNFDGRKPLGDNPYDISDASYGNGNPGIRDSEESHGTHVAGIIGAVRGNKKGVDGVAKAVKIMAVRTVPDGDEYDKDVALAIRYAVDNGAKVINASFGKKFSPNAEWVYDALKYAEEKDVLFVHAAGNDGLDLDDLSNTNYPNDHQLQQGKEIVSNYLAVGALTSSYGPNMVASFSNYGKENVDIFAPGDGIYSTMPNNSYEFQGGTSMAAPAVSGIAALIRAYFPQLSAAQVKQVIMDSGLPISISIQMGDQELPFSAISKTGKIANLYNALLLASRMAASLQGS